jgi:hypothetical protein
MSAANPTSLLASESGLPISVVTILASSSARSVKSSATAATISARSPIGTSFHVWYARRAWPIAASTSSEVAVGNVSTTSPVAGLRTR